MGVGAQKRAPSAAAAPQNSSSTTASFVAPEVKRIAPVIVRPVDASEGALPPSYDLSEVNELLPNVLLNPTGDNDLNYFHAIASGDPPQRKPTSHILAMNLFRTTQKHLLPLDERIALGSSLSYPYYSLLSAPSLSSVDEFNRLTISRRNPALARWNDICISEIQPRLKLLAGGVMVIAKMTVTRRQGLVGESYTITWEKAKDTYTVWRNVNAGANPKIDITLDEWESLDDTPGDGGGVIRAKSRVNGGFSASHNDLAVLDASKPSLQLISTSLEAHQMMDLLVGSLLTVAIVHTRMAKLGRAAMARPRGPDILVRQSINVYL